MRLPALIVSWLIFAWPAAAEPLQVTKGMWSVTSDIYISATAEGEPIDVPSEHSVVDECWMTDEEVTIDESMAAHFGGCYADNSVSKAHSFDMGLVCDIEGVPMTGAAQFAVSKGGGSFVGRMFMLGEDGVLGMEAEALLIGHRTGACPAPN